MRYSDQPLPGDIIIAQRFDTTTDRPSVVYVLTRWPHDVVAGGPYQSFAYARQQATKLASTLQAHIWRLHAPPGGPEAYEDLMTEG